MNRSSYAPYATPQFALLSESQLEEIHLATLEVLRRTGVRFHHRGALELLRQAGAFVDGNLVKFPASLVESALASAPRRIVMCDRHGEPAMLLEGRRTYFGTGSDTLRLLDPVTGERRPWTTKDICDSYRLCDALPNIHFQMSNGIPSDVPEGVSLYQWQYLHLLQYTTKPIVFVCNDYADAANIIEMASIVVGGRERLRECPLILLYSEPSSPLQQSETAIDKLLLMAETSTPVVHSPGPMMGATAPIHMAGGLVMSNAEILSALVVHQLKNPGAPFVYGAGLHHMDMKSMQICYASPEFQLTKAAVAELGRYYGLPTWGYAGCSDAKVMDEQAAAEAMLSVIMAKLSGANLIHDVGYMESGLTVSLEMIVLTDELVALADHLIKGIQVNDETLSVDTLHEVGPGGNFLAHPSTVAHFRDFWFPSLSDRYTYEEWQARGGQDMYGRLNQRVRDILASHQPEPLPKETVERMQAVIG